MTTTMQDYGYRAWSDVTPGDYVVFGGLRPDFAEVVSVEPIPAEMTVTGSADYVRVTVEQNGRTLTTAHRKYDHTTVYYVWNRS